MMTKRTLGSAGGLLTVFLSTYGSANLCAAPGKLGSFSEGGGDFYVGLSYSPAFSRISGFDIRESTGETAAVYPYLKDGKRVEWKATNFDWNTPDPRIRFKDNALVALEASIGYSIGAARVELEIGYEQFKTKGIRDTGSKEEEADTVYLLAKKLPHTLVSGESEKFKEELAKTEAKDIVAFAQAVGQQAKDIDGKVCKGRKVQNTDKAKEGGRWSCVDHTNAPQTGDNAEKPFSWRFGTAWDKEHKTPGDVSNTNKGWPGTTAGTTDTAEGMAGDLNKLLRTEKAKVAGLLSKTISGAEVVEIRAVSTTSVMLNACYDLQIVTATDQRNTFVVRRTTTAITRLGFVWGC